MSPATKPRAEGKGGAAEGDDAGVGLDQVTEDTGQAEQHSGDMGSAHKFSHWLP